MDFVKVILIIFSGNIFRVCGQCTFQSPFASSTWHDNTRGTLVFGTTTMSGWSVTILSQTITAWQCADSSNSNYLVIRSQSTFLYSATQFYAYLCMSLTKISDYSYMYYQQHNMELNAGSERMKFSTSTDLTLDSVCDFTASLPTLEFHVLVQSGNEVAAAITCADTLLYHADYSYSDGTTTACADTADSWDVCTDSTRMTFNYTTCSQEIAYSAGGQLYCVANMAVSGYQCSVVYNTDASIVSTTRQFSCICSNGVMASVAPNNCTSDQSPALLPTEADGTTTTGHLLTYGTQYDPDETDPAGAVSSGSSLFKVYCGPESSSSEGLSGGVIAGIVIAVLVVIAAVAVGIYCYLRHRKNKVSESEKPMLSNGVAHVETVNETSNAAPRREKSSISAISREKSDVNKSLIQRNATMSSIGLSMKREKSNITQVQPREKEEIVEEKPATLLGFNVSFLPCFKPKVKKEEDKQKGEDAGEKKTGDGGKKTGDGEKKTIDSGKKPGDGEKKTEDGEKTSREEEKNKGDDSKGTFLSILPCFKKKEETIEVKPEEPPEEVKPEKKPKAAPPKKGKGAKKGAKGKAKKPASKGKKPQKTQESQTDKKEDMAVTDVDETDKVESIPLSPKREKTDLLGNMAPQMTSTPKPEPSQKSPQMSKRKPSQKSPQMSKKTDGKPVPVKNGIQSTKSSESTPVKTPAVVNGLLKPTSTESKEWTFLACCFGNRSPPPQDVEDAEKPPEQKEEKKPAPKGKKATKGKAVAKKAPVKKGGKKGGGKVKKNDDNNTKKEDEDNVEEIKEENKLERAKTMPERQREKTALSITDAERVKVDVYIPDEKTQLQLKDTVTVMKGKTGEAPTMEKSKSDLGLARPGSSVSRTSSLKSKPSKSGAAKATKKGKKAEKGAKGGKEKKAAKKKKK